MPRARDPNRDKAYELWINSDKQMLLKDIAAELGVSDSQIRKWKSQDKWDRTKSNVTNQMNGNVTKQKGGQPGNRNAVGSGPPKGSQNNFKHGLYSRYLPQETREIINNMQCQKPVDLIWIQIEIQFAAIIRAQKIMNVVDQDDIRKETKSYTDTGKTYQFQFAWDRHASFLTAQSKAMAELRGLIKQFNEIAPEADERRLKLEQMQLNIDKTKLEIDKFKADNEDPEYEDDGFIEAMDKAAKNIWGSDADESN